MPKENIFDCFQSQAEATLMTAASISFKDWLFLIIIILYNLVTLIVSIAITPFFLISKRGRFNFWERFGFWSNSTENKEINWFHAASAGEMVGLLEIVKGMSDRIDPETILITAGSDTGFKIASKQFQNTHLLFFDCWIWFAIAFKNTKINRFIVAETEIWPGIFYLLVKKKVPIFLVNARLTQKSFTPFSKLNFLIRNIFEDLSYVFTGDKISESRFIDLGARKDRVKYTGNSKYDRKPAFTSNEEIQKFHSNCFLNKKAIVTLGSLHPGEEAIWLNVLSQSFLKDKINLLLVPRHLDKVGYFKDQLTKKDIKHEIFNVNGEWGFSSSTVIINAFGYLEKLYAISDLAFIGGTLINIGGHNPVEALIYGTPITVGPFHQNIVDIIKPLLDRNAGTLVKTEEDVVKIIESFLHDGAEYKIMGEKGRVLGSEHTGATQRIIQHMLDNS